VLVVSASRRTDIPALYWRWFMTRLAAGYCHWVNPFNTNQVFRVSLLPEDVAAIVFWTRNAGPMLKDITLLEDRGYAFYVQYTLNSYPRELERNSPVQAPAMRALRQLSELIGPERVIWRYDPIIFSSVTSAAYHQRKFAELAADLRGAASSAYISFCDPYGRTRRHFERLNKVSGLEFWFGDPAEHTQLARDLLEIATSEGLKLFSCAEAGLDVEGVRAGSCIDPRLISHLRPDLDFRLKPAPTREACGCVEAADIGAFDSCIFGCEYCYANQSAAAARRRHQRHDPNDSLVWRPPSLCDVDLETSELVRPQRPARIKPREHPSQLQFGTGEEDS